MSALVSSYIALKPRTESLSSLLKISQSKQGGAVVLVDVEVVLVDVVVVTIIYLNIAIQR